ncbi:unnamed protein product [Parascedosporium putredinis]|uniref:Uncharacterized protein n=1 Tax=Parascedosporium putredinis TaxID=1442378 RepID=A0A9P1GWI1_9PEZI|nr:unnamed protein product [Parascedosporium putredinis]CAI7989561.1 unnamed protein product [Parascedosporium putredinis]
MTLLSRRHRMSPEPIKKPEETSPPQQPPRRRRGRPRKDWTPLDDGPAASDATSSPTVLTPASSTEPDSLVSAINVADAELLFHFLTRTAQTFATDDDEKAKEDRMVQFWKSNAPRIGFAHPFVLRLIFAVTGRHMASLETDKTRQPRLASVADQHFSAGVSDMVKELANIGPNNCGALYIGAVLVCYCSFAAGPTTPGDLLVCNIDGGDDDDAEPARWLPMIRGLKLIRAAVDESVLFSGLMAPLGPSDAPANEESGPVFVRQGFPRLDWEEPLEKLRSLVHDDQGPNAPVLLRALDQLIVIYEAVYGRGDGVYDGPSENGLVFGWLYRLDNKFIHCLSRLMRL